MATKVKKPAAKQKPKRSTTKKNSFFGNLNSKFSRLSPVKKALVFALIFGLIGGIIAVYNSWAGPNTGFTHEHLNAQTSVGETKVTETRAAKRNATVVQITNPASVATAKAVYQRTVAPGKYEACVNLVSQAGSPSGTFSIRSTATGASTSLGSRDFVNLATSTYVKTACMPIDYAGQSGQAGTLEATVTNTTPGTSLRVSSILLVDTDGPTPPVSCTVGTLGPNGPCVNNSLIPAARAGYSDSRLVAGGGGGGEPGAFRQRCDYSHMNYDDAILYPGRPGEAHLHTYFGNTRANASSTSASLRSSGNSTCAGGIFNRSAYWVPSMIETTTGRPIVPKDNRTEPYHSDLEIYYKLGYQGVGYQDVNPFPNGLQMIAGNLSSATSETQNSRTKYYCETSDEFSRFFTLPASSSIPSCPRGNIVVMTVDFPQCWNGQLTSSNGRSHLAYGTWQPGENQYTTGCPASHPRGIPSVLMIVRWTVETNGTSTWKLSSDRYTSGPGGYSGHADYMFAWDTSAFPLVKQNCYIARVDCGYSLGNGTEPLWRRSR